jgi:membrane-bound serine protease (ClpP class)
MWCHLLLMSPVIGLGLFLILPWPIALPLYLVIVAFSIFLYTKIIQSMHRPVVTGRESLLGRVAEVGPRGKLKVAGERWLITHPEGLAPGQQVRIVGFRGLRLEVQSVDEGGLSPAPHLFKN